MQHPKGPIAKEGIGVGIISLPQVVIFMSW
jgi:hypothetical protein